MVFVGKFRQNSIQSGGEFRNLLNDVSITSDIWTLKLADYFG
jgi:hypothetical protein